MTNSKWIRRALLGGAAMTVMAAGAQADDLSALKAQIESLQARVNTIEARGAALPEGVSFITFQRGSDFAMKGGDDTKFLDRTPSDRGFTIAITPTADLPAPATEINLAYQVRVLALWGKTKVSGVGSDSDFDLAARGTLDLRAKVDTAVGQVRGRMQIRNQFSGFSFGLRGPGGTLPVVDDSNGDQTTTSVEARLAFGEWDFMPGWTLLAGHAGQIAAVSNVGYATQPAMYGLDSTRDNQIRLTYSGGPISFGFGIENPSQDNRFVTTGAPANTTTVPDFAGFAQFNAPGGMSLRVTGEAGKVGGKIGGGTNTGYLVGVGTAAQISMLRFNAGFVYTKGLGCDGILSAGQFGYCRVDEDDIGSPLPNFDNTPSSTSLAKAYGVQANMGATLTEALSANAGFGYFNYTNLADPDMVDHGYSFGGNIVWRPVDALQVAAEVDYFKVKTGTGIKGSTLAGGLGFWFTF